MSDSQWGEEFNPDNIVLNGKFDKFVSTFNEELREGLQWAGPWEGMQGTLKA